MPNPNMMMQMPLPMYQFMQNGVQKFLMIKCYDFSDQTQVAI